MSIRCYFCLNTPLPAILTSRLSEVVLKRGDTVDANLRLSMKYGTWG